ncbi:hypothetical protein C5Y44_00255 [Corynebacterium sp. J010B-136]|nr:hypothetical protein C5Y44_00255 [Corynebacterium sp. J010B-136]
MPQLHINHVRNQVEIEYHLNMFISAFRTDAAGDPEFTYEDLLAYFLHFPTSSGSTAQFGEDWWRLQVNAEQIMSGEPGDSERFHHCERPEFFGDSAYLELVVHGDGTETAAVRAHDGELMEDCDGAASGDYLLLMRSLASLVRRAKEDPGYFPVTSWHVTYSRGDGEKDWKIWFLAGCEKGEPPRWSPYWSTG